MKMLESEKCLGAIYTHELRDLYDDRVISAWRQGDSDYELGVSLETLYQIHKAYHIVNYLVFFEGLTAAELTEYDVDAAIDLYRGSLRELMCIYRNWRAQGLTLIPCYA